MLSSSPSRVSLSPFTLEGNDIEPVLNAIRDKGVYGKWWHTSENGVAFAGIHGQNGRADCSGYYHTPRKANEQTDPSTGIICCYWGMPNDPVKRIRTGTERKKLTIAGTRCSYKKAQKSITLLY